ncbi:uncharacterized protein LOC123439903 isoform X2 [Hordeum vulgare subsp. vulgare]|uniref:uncharacterized protein LOC123439903 isoform X2 n=1 Tax=Hordeum vulgare subsp. vulgare TaxID=112509 RepID=UPI001D1A4D47|nr:uncharacterized protein LOC123439903 isoform X2 [Hordeum vulgare subsp. vulgare]
MPHASSAPSAAGSSLLACPQPLDPVPSDLPCSCLQRCTELLQPTLLRPWSSRFHRGRPLQAPLPQRLLGSVVASMEHPAVGPCPNFEWIRSPANGSATRAPCSLAGDGLPRRNPVRHGDRATPVTAKERAV